MKNESYEIEPVEFIQFDLEKLSDAVSGLEATAVGMAQRLVPVRRVNVPEAILRSTEITETKKNDISPIGLQLAQLIININNINTILLNVQSSLDL